MINAFEIKLHIHTNKQFHLRNFLNDYYIRNLPFDETFERIKIKRFFLAEHLIKKTSEPCNSV